VFTKTPFSERLDAGIVRRYLRLLGVSLSEPSLTALEELVGAHLTCVPFENISKLYYLQRFGLTAPPDIHRYLDGIEQYHFGGTCYSNNFHFYSLLRSLGYEVKLCGADMSASDVHMVSVVTIDGREYLVDGGYAAPFLSPMPRDLDTDYEIALGRDRYVLKPQNALGCSRMAMYRDGVLKHGYLVKPEPKCLNDFSTVLADSFQPTATFRNAVLLARFWPGLSTVIHNLSLVESEGKHCTIHTMSGRNELIDGIEEHFAIPSSIAAEALNAAGELRDAWE